MTAEELFWDLVEPMYADPAVQRSTMMGLPCVRLDGRFFASLDRRTGALLVKLSAERVRQLIDASPAPHMVTRPACSRYRSSPEALSRSLEISASTRKRRLGARHRHGRQTAPCTYEPVPAVRPGSGRLRLSVPPSDRETSAADLLRDRALRTGPSGTTRLAWAHAR